MGLRNSSGGRCYYIRFFCIEELLVILGRSLGSMSGTVQLACHKLAASGNRAWPATAQAETVSKSNAAKPIDRIVDLDEQSKKKENNNDFICVVIITLYSSFNFHLRTEPIAAFTESSVGVSFLNRALPSA